MLPVGSFIGDAASGAGLVAACIAVGGFLMQVPPALAREDDESVRAATVVGGVAGLAFAVFLMAIGALLS
jgi:hypothetical protein